MLELAGADDPGKSPASQAVGPQRPRRTMPATGWKLLTRFRHVSSTHFVEHRYDARTLQKVPATWNPASTGGRERHLCVVSGHSKEGRTS